MFSIINSVRKHISKLINNYYIRYKITSRQSLGYQIMLIFMNEHYCGRNNFEYLGKTLGDDKLIFSEEEFRRMSKKVLDLLSNNYKEKIFPEYLKGNNYNKTCLEQIENLIVDYLPKINENYCTLNINLDNKDMKYMFIMKNQGYRYQYNGYKQSELKIMQLANTFIIITLMYYIIDFLFEFKKWDLVKNLKYLIPLLSGLSIVYFFRSLSNVIKGIILFIILIIFIA